MIERNDSVCDYLTGPSDVVLLTHHVTIPPNSVQLIPIQFQLENDGVAQESEETFTLSINNLNSDMFIEGEGAINDTMTGRIQDSDGKSIY